MQIIIAGMGEVGIHLAQQLPREGHHVTVIDRDQALIERVNQTAEVKSLHGSSTAPHTLEDAGVRETDLVIAVTSSEETNITTCMLAKKMGAKKTVARISNDEFNRVGFNELGIDEVVCPETLAAQEIILLIERAAATDIHEFEEGKLTLIGLRVEKGAPIDGKTLQQIGKMSELHRGRFRFVVRIRGGRDIIPQGKDLIRSGDQILVVALPDSIDEVLRLAGKVKRHYSKVMILGDGGKLSLMVAAHLQKSMNVKLLEPDEAIAEQLANQLGDTLILRGGGQDIDLMIQESLADMDVFVAVSDQAETNIITCLMARHLGVKKTIALVDNASYIPLSQTIGINALINKKMIAASEITRSIRKGTVVSMIALPGIDAEFLEYIATPDCRVTGKEIRKIKFPDSAIVAGIIRGDTSFIAVGDTIIQPEDRVLVVARPEAIPETGRLFSK